MTDDALSNGAGSLLSLLRLFKLLRLLRVARLFRYLGKWEEHVYFININQMRLLKLLVVLVVSCCTRTCTCVCRRTLSYL